MIPEFTRNVADRDSFNQSCNLPYKLRITDFESAMQDVYDFFHDVNSHLLARGLERLDEMLRPAIMSGVLSVMTGYSENDVVGQSVGRRLRD